eukprot:SAG31_NODE_126_length_23665_cov_6.178987_8_plen_105_part_00
MLHALSTALPPSNMEEIMSMPLFGSPSPGEGRLVGVLLWRTSFKFRGIAPLDAKAADSGLSVGAFCCSCVCIWVPWRPTARAARYDGGYVLAERLNPEGYGKMG